MSAENKVFIKSFLLSGLVYAGLMAGFDYSEGQEFSIWRFILGFLFFGIFMGLVSRYKHKKQLKKEIIETDIKRTESKTE
jgi:preprotein translocase subunit SecG